MAKSKIKLNKKQNPIKQLTYQLGGGLNKIFKDQMVNLKYIEKMEKKYDKKFEEVFSLLEQLVFEKKRSRKMR